MPQLFEAGDFSKLVRAKVTTGVARDRGAGDARASIRSDFARKRRSETIGVRFPEATRHGGPRRVCA